MTDAAIPADLSAVTAPLRLTCDGPLAVLTMNNPPANLFHPGMFDAWSRAAQWLTAYPPRGLLIRANGRVVSAGVDPEIFTELGTDDAETFWARQLAVVQAVESLPCPTVFAAHSLTLTAAFELALACDFIVSTTSARFGLVERKIAFTPAMGGTQRLAERAGPARAREAVMTGDLYRGETLAQWGVINALFQPATFHEDARAYAIRLASGPTLAHAATKLIIRTLHSGGVAEADKILPGLAAALHHTDDHRRALAAFIRHGPEHETRYTGR